MNIRYTIEKDPVSNINIHKLHSDTGKVLSSARKKQSVTDYMVRNNHAKNSTEALYILDKLGTDKALPPVPCQVSVSKDGAYTSLKQIIVGLHAEVRNDIYQLSHRMTEIESHLSKLSENMTTRELETVIEEEEEEFPLAETKVTLTDGTLSEEFYVTGTTMLDMNMTYAGKVEVWVDDTTSVHPDYINGDNQVIDPISLEYTGVREPVLRYVMDEPHKFNKSVFCEYKIIPGGKLAPSGEVSVEPM